MYNNNYFIIYVILQGYVTRTDTNFGVFFPSSTSGGRHPNSRIDGYLKLSISLIGYNQGKASSSLFPQAYLTKQPEVRSTKPIYTHGIMYRQISKYTEGYYHTIIICTGYINPIYNRYAPKICTTYTSFLSYHRLPACSAKKYPSCVPKQRRWEGRLGGTF